MTLASRRAIVSVQPFRQLRDRRLFAPQHVRERWTLAAIALPHRFRSIEWPAQRTRSDQLQVLGVRPHQRHGRPGRPARLEAARRDGSGIPDLLGQHPARGSHARHGDEQRQRIVTAAQLVVTPLAAEQRPGSAAAGAVESAPVVVLAITVAVVAVPAWARGRVDLQQCIGHLDARGDERILRAAQAEANQLQEVDAHLGAGRQARILLLVANRHDQVGEAALRREHLRGRHAHVVARHLLCPRAAGCRVPRSSPRGARSSNRRTRVPGRGRRRADRARRPRARRCIRRA